MTRQKTSKTCILFSSTWPKGRYHIPIHILYVYEYAYMYILNELMNYVSFLSRCVSGTFVAWKIIPNFCIQ